MRQKEKLEELAEFYRSASPEVRDQLETDLKDILLDEIKKIKNTPSAIEKELLEIAEKDFREDLARLFIEGLIADGILPERKNEDN